MDKSIQLKSIKLAWIYMVVFLCAWCFYEIHISRTNNYSPINQVPVFLLITQNLVLGLSQWFFQMRSTAAASQDDDEEKESLLSNILSFVLVAFVLIIMMNLVLFYIFRWRMG